MNVRPPRDVTSECRFPFPLLARDYLQLLKMVGKFFDHCLNFPTIYTGEQIVYELNISPVGLLLYYVKYMVHFLNFKSYCFTGFENNSKR